MRLIAKVIRISHAKFHCSRLTTVQGIQDYASLIFWDTVYIRNKCNDKRKKKLRCLRHCLCSTPTSVVNVFRAEKGHERTNERVKTSISAIERYCIIVL